MSRIGKKPVPVPGGVTATVDGQEIKVKGPKGELSHVLVDQVIAKMGDDGSEIGMVEDNKDSRAMWGVSRTIVANLVTGVTEGFSKTLEINGVGYRAAMKGFSTKEYENMRGALLRMMKNRKVKLLP